VRNLTEIINWRRLNNRITLSGQPTKEQLVDIQHLGVTCIVNLAPHTNKGALDNEAECVEKLNMAYVHIPVDFEKPTESDYTQFCHALKLYEDVQIHVHCIYNARVTAFFYRHAQQLGHDSELQMRALMDGIWRPGGVWAKFIGRDEDTELANRYAGYDY